MYYLDEITADQRMNFNYRELSTYLPQIEYYMAWSYGPDDRDHHYHVDGDACDTLPL